MKKRILILGLFLSCSTYISAQENTPSPNGEEMKEFKEYQQYLRMREAKGDKTEKQKKKIKVVQLDEQQDVKLGEDIRFKGRLALGGAKYIGENASDTNQYRLTGELGGYAEIPLNEKIYVGFGAEFVGKGTSSSGLNYNTAYLQFPAYFTWSGVSQESGFGLEATGGLYYGVAINNSITDGEYEYDSSTYAESTKDTDMGYLVGLGIVWDYVNTVDIRYSQSLNTVYNYGYEIKNSVITIGYTRAFYQ